MSGASDPRPAASARDSVFLRALGTDAERLSPEVREYVAGPGEGCTLGRGHGVFEIAGSPYRRLAGLARLVTGPLVMLTRYEREVPFEIVNRPSREAGRLVLRAEREFRFRGGMQRFVDALVVGAAPGTLVNVLGPRGRVELLLECTATSEGNLRLRSRAARVRLGGRAFRLPSVLGMRVEAVDGWDAARERRTIDAVVRSPLLGTVLRYRGWFRYDYEAP